jgi:hypothetical protein
VEKRDKIKKLKERGYKLEEGRYCYKCDSINGCYTKSMDNDHDDYYCECINCDRKWYLEGADY